MDRVRTALVGCGKVGADPRPGAGHAGRVRLRGRLRRRRRPGGGIRRGDTAGSRSPTSRAMLSRLAASQALVIGTPHPLHAGPAILAAEAGVHVLVEKPMAASLADCDAMLAAARRHGVKLGVISQRRWYEPVLRMKAAIDAGKIGRPVLGTFVMYSWRDPSYYRSDPWRGRWDTEGGGVLVNQSPAHARPAPLAHGRRGRRGQRLLGQPEPPLRRGRGHRRGDPPLPRRRPRLDRHQPGAEAGDLHQGPHPRVERRERRRRDRPGRDLHRRRLGRSPSRRSTTSGPSPARRTASRRSRPRIAAGSRPSMP